MNSASNTRCISCICIAVVLLCAVGSAMGDSLTFGPASSVAGDSQNFSFTVTLNASHPLYDFSLYLEASAASSFSITGETVSGNSPITDGNFIGTFPVLLSTTANSPDFGYGSTGTTDIVAGTYTIATLTVAVGANVPHGGFSITTTTGISGSEYNDAEGDIYDLPQATETISVPEPAASLALFLTTMLLTRRPNRGAPARA